MTLPIDQWATKNKNKLLFASLDWNLFIVNISDFCLYKKAVWAERQFQWSAVKSTMFDDISNSVHGHLYRFHTQLTWHSICRIRCPSRTMESFLVSPCSQPALFLFQSEDWTTPDLLIVGIICYKNATFV